MKLKIHEGMKNSLPYYANVLFTTLFSYIILIYLDESLNSQEFYSRVVHTQLKGIK